jgi:hypothetical protein
MASVHSVGRLIWGTRWREWKLGVDIYNYVKIYLGPLQIVWDIRHG